jgi:hypothetical protein
VPYTSNHPAARLSGEQTSGKAVRQASQDLTESGAFCFARRIAAKVAVEQDAKKFTGIDTEINPLPSRKQDRLDSGHSFGWKSAFDAAVRETNLAQLRKHVMSAEEAIYLRMQEQVNAPNDAELQAMQEAILVLREIQVTKLGYPDWKKK